MTTLRRSRCFSKAVPALLAVSVFSIAALLAACPGKDEENGSRPEAVPGKLKAGAAFRLLELPVGHSHAGYTQTAGLGQAHPPDDPGSPFAHLFPASRGIESPGSARVLVLDNGHHRVVIARLDLIYITADLTTRIMYEARERFGIDLEGRLLLSSTHTHAMGHRVSKESVLPDLPPVDDFPPEGRHALAHGGDTYSEESMVRIAVPTAEAIAEAVESLRPARMGWGTTENHNAARDRRCENEWLFGPDYFDPTVSVLRVDDAESGAPIAVAFHYGAHGTMNGSTNRNLSVDGIGHAEFKVEESFEEPVVALFLQGTAGDVSPSSGGRGHRGTQGMERFGWDLARSVMEAYEAIETRDTVVLQSMQRWVPLGYSILDYDWESDEFHDDGAIFCNILYFFEGCQVEGPNDPDKVVCAAPVLPDGGKYHTLLAAARIDELFMVTMPGEAVTEVGRLLREEGQERGAEHTLVLGFSMDHDGYILTAEDWLSGGYEPTITFWGWRFGPFIIEQSADLLDEMLTGEAPRLIPAGEVPSNVPEDYDPVLPSASATEPAVDEDLPESVERLSEVVLSFFGGDPSLGTPKVLLERQGEQGDFQPVLVGGWRPFSNHLAHGLPLRYEPAPTYLEEPGAGERTHRFEVVWETLPDTPEGVYRLSVTGKWLDGEELREYSLRSGHMRVLPTDGLELTARVVDSEGEHLLALLVRYPAEGPRYSELPGSGGWQVGRFRMLDPFFGPGFVPLWREARVGGELLVSVEGGEEQPLEVVFDAWDELPEERSYAPAEGPGFLAELPGDGPWEITVPPGVLADSFGNSVSGPRVLSLEAP